MKKKLCCIILFLCFVFVPALANQNKTQAHYSYFSKTDLMKSFMDWQNHVYQLSYQEKIPFQERSDFVLSPLQMEENIKTKIRYQIFKDLSQIWIDNEIKISDLWQENKEFQEDFNQLLFASDLFRYPAFQQSEIKIFANVFFRGKNGLLEKILRSRYFVDKNKMKIAASKYQEADYQALILEARDMKVRPTLFPKIYAYDKNGKIFLVYSIFHANWEAIQKNGYAQFFNSLEDKIILDKKNYYCAALKTYGTSQTDFLISYQDYVKFFGSRNGIKNLTEGKLFILIAPE